MRSLNFLLCSLIFLLCLAAGGALLPGAAAAAGDELVTGIVPCQVFPFDPASFRARISMKAKVTGSLRIEVVDSQSREIVADALYDIDPAGPHKYDPPIDAQVSVKTASRDLLVCKVPLNTKGDYIIRLTAGQKKQEIEHILVGELWVVSGGTNAFGAPSRRQLSPNAMVHYCVEGKWEEGKEPLFPPSEINVSDSVLTPWLRAAQDYTLNTGIPVGIVGWAMPGMKLSSIFDSSGENVPPLKTIFEKYARGASVLFWFQGETEPGTQSGNYGPMLKKLAGLSRKYAGNNNLLFVVCQNPCFKDPKGQSHTPAWGRIREAQRKACAEDPRAILLPTMYLSLRAPALLDEEAVSNLGIRLGETLTGTTKTRKPVWQGPRCTSAVFTNSSRQTIQVRFDGVERLVLRANAQLDWAVTDDKHLGYAEITAPEVRDGVLTFQINGARCGVLENKPSDTSVRLKLQDTGYISATKVTPKGKNMLEIDLAQPAAAGAKLHYAFWDDSTGSLQDGEGRYAAAFMDLPITDPGAAKK